MELINLVKSYNFSIPNYLAQMGNFPTRICDCDCLSQSCSIGFIYFFWHYYLINNGFPSIGKFWSCCSLSFHWLSNKLETGCLVSSQLFTILVKIGTVFMIIWEMFHGRISLNSVLLLLLVNFVSSLSLKLMYISPIVSIWSNLTISMVAKVHTNLFFHLHQHNKSSESTVKFIQGCYCCKRVLEAPKFAYATKTKEFITSQ